MHARTKPDKPALKPADTRSSDPSSNHAIPPWASAGKPRVLSSRHSMNERGLPRAVGPSRRQEAPNKIGLAAGPWTAPPRSHPRPLGVAPLVDQEDVPYGRLAPTRAPSPPGSRCTAKLCLSSSPGQPGSGPSLQFQSRLVQSPSGPFPVRPVHASGRKGTFCPAQWPMAEPASAF